MALIFIGKLPYNRGYPLIYLKPGGSFRQYYPDDRTSVKKAARKFEKEGTLPTVNKLRRGSTESSPKRPE
jgi:hypothetical protein